ncbi:hypothetical protein NIES2101_00310 [Calothrix sp. HK-06]|nr:hypothetical protein NIES2101_00310 [Calothrix sp. HK-06]
MSKSLGFYAASTDTHEQMFLDYLQDVYGSTFEGMTKIQKLALLAYLANGLLNVETQMIGTSIATEQLEPMHEIFEGVQKYLTIGMHLPLADAVVNQIKYQY